MSSRSCASPTASGPDLRTSHTALLSLPAVPSILGFDPRYQFIHADDIPACSSTPTRHDLPGVYNAAADGVLALSEVASLLGSRPRPSCRRGGQASPPPPCAGSACELPPEMLRQLRYGRGLDNRRLKAAGYAFRATSRETVLAFADHLRMRHIAEQDGATATSARSRSSCAGAPAWAAATASAGAPAPEQLAQLARALESLQGGGGALAPRGDGSRGLARHVAAPARPPPPAARADAELSRRPVVGDVEDADLAERDPAGADQFDHAQRDVRVELLAG